jgi:hypothetical protein
MRQAETSSEAFSERQGCSNNRGAKNISTRCMPHRERLESTNLTSGVLQHASDIGALTPIFTIEDIAIMEKSFAKPPPDSDFPKHASRSRSCFGRG